MTKDMIEYITVGTAGDARDIAILARAATTDDDAPTLVWLGGYRSDMTGTKAVELDRYAKEEGFACIRLDYSGHGASRGDFNRGTISRWLEETIAVLRHKAPKRIIVIGSSMGGWIALRLVQELRKVEGGSEIAGLLLIAPAPDFTAELIEPNLSPEEKASLAERGYFEEPSEYSAEPNIFTRDLIEDGRNNLVLTGILETGCPVHILQGMRDDDVPYTHALKLLDHLPADDIVLSLIRDGDHRLSRPQDIERMLAAAKSLVFSAKAQRS